MKYTNLALHYRLVNWAQLSNAYRANESGDFDDSGDSCVFGDSGCGLDAVWMQSGCGLDVVWMRSVLMQS